MKENGLQTQKIDCFVAGWGYRQENKWTSLPDILQDAQVHLLFNETCEATYTDIDNNGEPVSIMAEKKRICGRLHFFMLEGQKFAYRGNRP